MILLPSSPKRGQVTNTCFSLFHKVHLQKVTRQTKRVRDKGERESKLGRRSAVIVRIHYLASLSIIYNL